MFAFYHGLDNSIVTANIAYILRCVYSTSMIISVYKSQVETNLIFAMGVALLAPIVAGDGSCKM